MPWIPEAYSIILPNPYDIEGPWLNVETFDSKQAALDFVTRVFGGDAKGRIGLISHIDDEGWLVDLPNAQNPEEAWVFIESFPTKREAVKFTKDYFLTDSQGRLKTFDVMMAYVEAEEEEERGPRDWSPRWKKRKKK